MRPTLTSNFLLGYFWGIRGKPPFRTVRNKTPSIAPGTFPLGGLPGFFWRGSHFDIGFVAGILLEQGLTSDLLEGFMPRTYVVWLHWCLKGVLPWTCLVLLRTCLLNATSDYFWVGPWAHSIVYVYIHRREKIVQFLKKKT